MPVETIKWIIVVDLAAWVAWHLIKDTLRGWPSTVEDNARETQNAGQYTVPINPEVSTSSRDLERNWSREGEHQRREQRYWTFSTVFSGIAMVGAIVAAVAAVQSLGASRKAVKEADEQVVEARKQTGYARDAVEQYKAQTGIAQKSLIASNRPWLKFTSVKVSALEIQTDQVLIWVDFGYRNIGHSPANVIGISPALLIPQLEPWGFKEVRKLCADEKASKRITGDATFPDEDGNYGTVNFGRPMRDFIRARDTQLRERLAAWSQASGVDEAAKTIPLEKHLANSTGFTLIACLNYRFDGSDEVHGTSFVADIVRARPKVIGNEQSSLFDFTVPERVDGNDIKMTPGMLGKIAD